jgi:hypothetical protein
MNRKVIKEKEENEVDFIIITLSYYGAFIESGRVGAGGAHLDFI